MTGDTYLLAADDIAKLVPDVKSHFLNEKARRSERSLAKSTGLKELEFAIIEIAPGDESTEHHKHYHQEECLYVLEGEGVVEIGDENLLGSGQEVTTTSGFSSRTLRGRIR